MIDIRFSDIILRDIESNIDRYFEMAVKEEENGRHRKALEFLDMAIFYEKQLQEEKDKFYFTDYE